MDEGASSKVRDTMVLFGVDEAKAVLEKEKLGLAEVVSKSEIPRLEPRVMKKNKIATLDLFARAFFFQAS